jgi:sulfonate transport system ATP-binding protein
MRYIMAEKILEINHVKKQFQLKGETIEVLEDIDFSVEKGSITAIIGGSGCGKSTLLKLITALEDITDGEIRIDGTVVKKPSDKTSMIFQDARLFPWLNVEENIDFVLPRSMKKSTRKEIVEPLIELVGLSQFKDAVPSQLSGGMQQRVSIARALATKPDILLLDEPFGALDAFTRMNMQQELLRIWGIDKTTMVIVTHDIDEAIFLSNQIVIMSDRPGRVKKIIPIKLPHPRNRSSIEFLEARRKVLIEFFGDNDAAVEYYI